MENWGGDGDNGAVKWTYSTSAPLPAHARLTTMALFLLAVPMATYAIDAVTGLLKWKYSTGSNLGGSSGC